jgi:hypothetical protein
MASHDTEHARRDSLPLLLGVITIIGGVATGLFSDLRSDGKILGVVVFLLWAWIIGRVLWNPELTPAVRRLTSVVLALTVALVLVAVGTGPRLSNRTLLLTVEGAHNLNTACPGAADGQRAAAEVALGQLQSQFVHVTLKNGYCAGDDVRLRTGDLLTVAPQ